MAIENAKTLNVRIKNKYDSYENWAGSGLVLEAGEIAIAYTTVDVAVGNGKIEQHPQLLMKVGNGSETFANLPWLSAKAADVASWAKAANKPTYAASEITGMEQYIADYVETEMGISVDTDTQYQIVKVDDYNYKLQSKGKTDEAWADVADSVIVIPNDTEAIKALQDLVGEKAVATQISEAIAALDLANTYETKGEAAKVQTALDEYKESNDAAVKKVSDDLATEAQTARAAEQANATAAADALTEAQKKVASVTAADASITVAGTSTAPTVAAKVSQDADNALTLAEDGLKVVIPAAAEYSVVKDAEAGEYAAVYHLTKDGVNVGAAINIPKDMVVKSGSVVGDEIVLVLNDEAATEIKIPVGSLIEYVTSGSAAGDMVVVSVSDDHKVTASITDGSITLAKLSTEIQTAIGKAHSHENADVLNGINADKVAAWDAAEQNAKDHANDLNTAMDERMQVVEGKAHEHANAEVLNGISAEKVAAWDSAEADAIAAAAEDATTKANAAEEAAKKHADDLNTAMDERVQAVEGKAHEHENAEVLNGITAEKVSIWDSAIQEVTAAEGSGLTATKAGTSVAIALDESLTFILDCGSSSVNI